MRPEREKAARGQAKAAGRSEGPTSWPSHLLTFSSSHLLIFFVLSFVYLWQVVEPRLIYHGFGTILPEAPLFATGWPFLGKALGLPGGPVAYVSGFLSQGYYYSWLGAAIIVVVGFSLSALTRRHLAAAGFAQAAVPAAVPAVAFFLLCSHYKHPLPACLAVSLGLSLSLAFEKLPWRPSLAHAALGGSLAGIGFWFGGGGALLVFASLTAIYGVLASRDRRTIPLVLAVIAAISWILSEYVFLIPARQAAVTLTPLAPPLRTGMSLFQQVLMFLLYGFVPLAVLLTLLGRRVLARYTQRRAIRAKRPGKGHAVPRSTAGPKLAFLRQPAWAAVPVVLLALGLHFSHDQLRKSYVLSNYYAQGRQWDKLIELSRWLPRGRTNPFVNHDLLRALYHTGRLPYDMFRCPLIPEALLLTHEKGQSDLTQWKLCDVFLEFGHVNMAQKLASELIATKDHLGPALEKLAWIGVIKEAPETARVYLEALKKDVIHRDRARSLLHSLDHGFSKEQTAYLDRIRSCRCDETAGVTGPEPVDQTLATLLQRNPRNRMAFEYLMACHLLTGRVDQIAANIRRLRDLGYDRIPTLYEEAILIHQETAGSSANLGGYSVSRATRQRYEAFVQVLSAMQTQNRQAAFAHLVREFGTSYFFYYSFGRVGLV